MFAREPAGHDKNGDEVYIPSTPEQVAWTVDDSDALATVITSELVNNGGGHDAIKQLRSLGGNIWTPSAPQEDDFPWILSASQFSELLGHDGQDGFTHFESALKTILSKHLATDTTDAPSQHTPFRIHTGSVGSIRNDLSLLLRAMRAQDQDAIAQARLTCGDLDVIIEAYNTVFVDCKLGEVALWNEHYKTGLDALTTLLPEKSAITLKSDGEISVEGYSDGITTVWRKPQD